MKPTPLHQRLSEHLRYPLALVEKLTPQERLAAVAEAIDAANAPPKPIPTFVWLLLGLGLLCLVLLCMQTTAESRGVILRTGVAPMIGIWIARALSPSSKETARKNLQKNAAAIVADSLPQCKHASEVPLVLEAARRVEGIDALVEATLARLLPKLTETEAQALTEPQRAFLRSVLQRTDTVETQIALLLTLGAGGDSEVRAVAHQHLTVTDERVREAAQECLLTLGKKPAV